MVRRRIYFSFDYQNDLHRVKHVKCMPCVDARSAAGFYKLSEWTSYLKHGEHCVTQQIDENLKNTLATVVCIGSHTAENRFVHYEIEESMKRQNAIFGIQVHHLEDENGRLSMPGNPPFILQTNGYKSYKFVDHEWLQKLIAESLRHLVQ
jgi:hypothetical protein